MPKPPPLPDDAVGDRDGLFADSGDMGCGHGSRMMADAIRARQGLRTPRAGYCRFAEVCSAIWISTCGREVRRRGDDKELRRRRGCRSQARSLWLRARQLLARVIESPGSSTYDQAERLHVLSSRPRRSCLNSLHCWPSRPRSASTIGDRTDRHQQNSKRLTHVKRAAPGSRRSLASALASNNASWRRSTNSCSSATTSKPARKPATT